MYIINSFVTFFKYEKIGPEILQSCERERNRLVIFPMSGNNTFETSDFADPRSIFEAARVHFCLP